MTDSDSANSRRIGIFARWPEPGTVKTRLSPSLPASLACDLHRAMLLDTVSAAVACGATECALYWLGGRPNGDGPTLPAGVAVREQHGEDLGQRLRNGFDELLAAPGDRALAIGADCLELDGATLRRAFAALDGCDVVLGPANDGGYFLIGLRAPAPALFEDIAWGTGSVCAETLRRAKSAGLATVLLDPLSDLDTPEDLARFAARTVGSAAGAAPRTREALRSMGLLPAFG